MASVDGISPSDRRGGSLRRLLFASPKPTASASAGDRNPLISSANPSAPAAARPRSPRNRMGGLAAAAFRGLGCSSSSSSQAYAPAAAAVRSSADWQGKRPRRRRAKKSKERRAQAAGGDVWCAPGIPFAADASLDCVVAPHQPTVGRGGRPDLTVAERIHRERAYMSRRVGHQEQFPSLMDSPSNLGIPFLGPDHLPTGHLRQLRGYRRTPGGLEEIMMFQTRVLLGGIDSFDRYRDWRLDVDNMSYEELLELGDKIGYVSTGLREDEILRSLRKARHSIFDASARQFSKETEWKCSICQEEYEANEEIGRLECGHSFHTYCIKQWLLQKNACPVCKAAVPKT